MTPNNADIFSFINSLYLSKSFDEAFELYDQFLQSLGFQGALYTYIPKVYSEGDLHIVPVMKVSDTGYQSFVQHYIDAGFEKNDFAIQEVLNGRTLTLDWWKEEEKGLLTSAERNVIMTAREEYGINKGLTIPTMNNKLGIAGASVVYTDKISSYGLLVAERQQVLETCTQVFHEHVMSKPHLFHYFLLPILEKLTETEKRILPFIATGLPMKSNNLTPAVSAKYGDKLLRSIRKKFGNISKGRLIYYIGLLHILDFV